MLTILLNWIYIFVTTYIVGHAALHFFAERFHYEKKLRRLPVLLTGFAIVTAYAGYFSIFHGVGALANIILLILCILLIAYEWPYYRKIQVKLLTYTKNLKHYFSGQDQKEGSGMGSGMILLQLLRFGVGVLLIFAILFFTCYGTFHSDTGLYHAQSIRWIEEYGVIKGLGLLQNRFGYNSSFFCVSALYSFVFSGQSLHGVNGYMAALVTLYAYFCITNAFLHRSFGKLHTVVAFAPILYTVIGGLELISPTTDAILLYLVFAIAIRWTKLIDEEEQDVLPFALLCVLCAFLVSVKLSVGVLILLTVDVAVRLIRQKKVKVIFCSLGSGLVLILPYFIRNVIISGWLIYPFPAIDLFDLPWKIPEVSARNDAAEITTWARYVKDAEQIDQSVLEWAPVWWRGQSSMERLFSLTALVSLVIGLVWCIVALIRLIRNRKQTWNLKLQRMLFFELVIMLSFVFWFFSAPLIRYGYLYLLLLPLTTVAVLMNDPAVPSTLQILIPGIITCMLLYPTGNLMYHDISYMHHNWSRKYAVHQKEYPQAEVLEKSYAGTTFYYPKDPGNNVWYDAFPSVLFEENFTFAEPLGDSVADGFVIREQTR